MGPGCGIRKQEKYVGPGYEIRKANKRVPVTAIVRYRQTYGFTSRLGYRQYVCLYLTMTVIVAGLSGSKGRVCINTYHLPIQTSQLILYFKLINLSQSDNCRFPHDYQFSPKLNQ